MDRPDTARQPASPSRPLGPINSGELLLRLSLATPNDTAKGMFFNGALSAVKGWLGEEAAERCRAASGEKKFIDFFNYPIAGFLKLSFSAAEMLQPKFGSHDEVFRNLGRQATDDFLATTVGKMLLGLAGRDPRRLFSVLPGGYKTAVSYGERTAELTAEKRCRFTMKRDFMPHPYHEGVLLAVIGSMGVANVRVVGQRSAPLDTTYDITWE